MALGICNLLDVLCFVLIGDRNIPTTGYQINCATLAKLLIVNRECKFNNSLNVIIPSNMLVHEIRETDCKL